MTNYVDVDQIEGQVWDKAVAEVLSEVGAGSSVRRFAESDIESVTIVIELVLTKSKYGKAIVVDLERLTTTASGRRPHESARFLQGDVDRGQAW